MEEYESFENDCGLEVRIYTDDIPLDPRQEWDNLGVMACYHRRYNLGDPLEFSDPDDLREFLKESKAIYLLIRAYEHGGITISAVNPDPDPRNFVGGYKQHCLYDPWDSGWLGVIYVTRERILEEFHCKKITRAVREKVLTNLFAEVETYDNYLTGAVFGFELICPTCEREIDSCWGFYGSDHDASGLMDYVRGVKCEHCEEVKAHKWELLHKEFSFEI